MVKITGSVSFSAADTYNCMNYDCIIEWVEEIVPFTTLVKFVLNIESSSLCGMNIIITIILHRH